VPARLIANVENHGFAAAVNQGLQDSEGEYVLLLNPDATLDQGAAEALVEVSGDVAGVSGAQAIETQIIGHNLMYILNQVKMKKKHTLKK